jgi:hypothetical protein
VADARQVEHARVLDLELVDALARGDAGEPTRGRPAREQLGPGNQGITPRICTWHSRASAVNCWRLKAAARGSAALG